MLSRLQILAVAICIAGVMWLIYALRNPRLRHIEIAATDAQNVIILAGQSNISGCGNRSLVELAPPSDITYVNNGFHCLPFGIFYRTANYFGPELSLSTALAKERSLWNIYKHAYGGSSLNEWLAEGGFLSQLLSAVVDISTKGYEIRAFVWMQGETESNSATDASQYYTRLKSLIAQVAETLPEAQVVVCTTDCDRPYSDEVVAAQMKLCGDLGIKCISTKNMSRAGDGVHLDLDGQLELGNAIYRNLTDTSELLQRPL